METLNERAWKLAEREGPRYGRVTEIAGGGRVIDLGIDHPGSLGAGVFLARLTLADLAGIWIEPGPPLAVTEEELAPSTIAPRVIVRVDDPVRACMASQYAGAKVEIPGYFAIGSGPFRALRPTEELYARIGGGEDAPVAVASLESAKLPGADVVSHLADRVGLPREKVLIAIAPTRSIAGGVQVVSRSVETALHKLDTLGFDLLRVVSGLGSAPLPPPAKDDLTALGRTNDAVLYGAIVHLWITGPIEDLEEIGPRVPSAASRDWGRPFGEIFSEYEYDFYKVDPHLFSPAEVRFHHLESGRTLCFGRSEPNVLRKSFGHV